MYALSVRSREAEVEGEGQVMDRKKIAKAVEMIIEAMGEDKNREGLEGTPDRVARMLEDLCNSGELRIATFKNEGYDQMVVKRGIKVWSLCEHHMLPMQFTVDIGYIPGERLIGLSKLARIAEHFGKGLQMQERYTNQVADYLMEVLRPKGVMVVVRGEHLCEKMRGVKTEGTMITSAVRGVFRESDSIKQEFLRLCQLER